MSTKRKAQIHSYTVVFEPLSDGGYDVVIPAIPEICTFGRTIVEAKRMAEEAIQCYLESMSKERKVPARDIKRPPRITRVSVKMRQV